MTAITDGQAEIRAGETNALVVGDDTEYMWVQGGPTWWGASEVVTSDQKRSGVDGYVLGRDLLGKHVTNVLVNILIDDESDAGDKIDSWKAACAASSDTTVAVRFNVFGRTRVRYGRFRIPGEADASLARMGSSFVPASAQFEVLDARTYGDDEHTAVTGREVEGAGVVLPATLPWSLPASSSGTISLVNVGNAPAKWSARFDGPLTNFALTHLEYDQHLAFTANGGISLELGEWATVDSDGHAVLFAGSADRRAQLTLDSQWWELGPGVNSIRLNADSGPGTATFTWRDSYLS